MTEHAPHIDDYTLIAIDDIFDIIHAIASKHGEMDDLNKRRTAQKFGGIIQNEVGAFCDLVDGELRHRVAPDEPPAPSPRTSSQLPYKIECEAYGNVLLATYRGAGQTGIPFSSEAAFIVDDSEKPDTVTDRLFHITTPDSLLSWTPLAVNELELGRLNSIYGDLADYYESLPEPQQSIYDQDDCILIELEDASPVTKRPILRLIMSEPGDRDQ